MAMALSDGVNTNGENRRKILRRFLVRKNKKDTIKGTSELSKIIWPEVWWNSNSPWMHFQFCRCLRLTHSIWYYIAFHALACGFQFKKIWFSYGMKDSGRENELLQWNCARESAMHSPESQIECFVFVVLSVPVIQRCGMPKIIIFLLRNWSTIAHNWYSVSGRSSESSSELWHE